MRNNEARTPLQQQSKRGQQDGSQVATSNNEEKQLGAAKRQTLLYS